MPSNEKSEASSIMQRIKKQLFEDAATRLLS